MLKPGDVITYPEMCLAEKVNLQRGMNFHLRDGLSVILMSTRPGAPYADRVEEDGKILIYEGHDVPRTPGGPDPKRVDQPESLPGGRRTQNGLFYEAAGIHKHRHRPAEHVKVYEKIRPGIWVYNGVFELVDAWQESVHGRKVFKFKLHLAKEQVAWRPPTGDADDDRIIPASVKQEVWKRDKGRCVTCGATSGLHFDHIIPYSKGGSSKDARNIQILCGRHNIAKRDNIE